MEAWVYFTKPVAFCEIFLKFREIFEKETRDVKAAGFDHQQKQGESKD